MAEESKEIRKKNKKPDFIVKEAKFCARVKTRWRFPRGKHSKVRQMHRGRQALPTPGYGAPKTVKHQHRSGLLMVVVHNQKDLSSLNPEKEGAVIASTVGKKNKLVILKLAEEKKIKIINVKDVSATVLKMENEFTEKKKLKTEKLTERSKKKEEKKKKAEEKKEKEAKEKVKKAADEKKEGLEESVVEDVKKKEEREAEKIITKRQ
ncbi:MAG: hypothetical protein KKH52_02620 [Nanoarchaeota archaeon]|nr:hypothetical protein [Nanoarchaeota archaeon]MBU1622648.1 hypothetical protein [Nanoarchaeota archaeon]MBU1974267.1 hypothetical protein [Nanoarchaeota archaeon]